MDIAGEEFDVIVVGAGNAATCAALSAREGGCARADAGDRARRRARRQFRFHRRRVSALSIHGVEDLARLIPDIERGPTRRRRFRDLHRGAVFRRYGAADPVPLRPRSDRDPDPAELRNRRLDARQGVRFQPGSAAKRSSVDGKFKFWGGLALPHLGRRQGTDEGASRARRPRRGVDDRSTRRRRSRLLQGDERRRRGAPCAVRRRVQICAPRRSCSPAAVSRPMPRCGRAISGRAGISPRCAASRFNTGDGLKMALDIGAAVAGQLVGRHAVAWDFNAPPFGDLDVGDRFQKHSYPFGIVINAEGERFLDEGADFHSYTYAKYGGEILKPARACSPGRSSTRRSTHLLRDEYRIRARHQGEGRHAGGTGASASKASIRSASCATVRAFNAALAPGRAVQPEHPGRAAAPRASRSTRPTGRSRSTRRPTRPMP